MNAKNRKTLYSIFHNPVKSDLPWKEIESLFNGLGGEISEGRGSRVRVSLNGVRAVFHRPHPQNITDKGALLAVRRFLTTGGVKL
jgi:hypothetical protein